MPACCEAKNRRLAYTAGGLVRRKLKAGNRETHSGKNQEQRQTIRVGAWCWIGGGQGALSQARKETGVACRPSKQLDYSSFVRENNVVRLISQPRNRKREADLTGNDESRGKFGPTGATKRAFSDEHTRWMWEPGVGGRQPGDTDSSD
jgi:hypothetical protein